MSTCPRELQSMLHACQHWSIRNRVQINTSKTKIMAFFETPALLRARGGQHQPGPTMPPFQVYSPFPTSGPRSYLIHKFSQFEYLCLILDPKLTMHITTVEAIRRASHVRPSRTCVTFTATQTSKKCKLASICPWPESYMYMATTQDFWQTQESLLSNQRNTFTSHKYTLDSP